MFVLPFVWTRNETDKEVGSQHMILFSNGKKKTNRRRGVVFSLGLSTVDPCTRTFPGCNGMKIPQPRWCLVGLIEQSKAVCAGQSQAGRRQES